ncbi:MAG: D-glycero-beta-D-manno-heptose 1,7-bisphosphate 7-phosphatase [bacterium]
MTSPVRTDHRRRAVFLDRDGTINVDGRELGTPNSYVHRPEDFILLPGVREAIRLLRGAGFLIVVVTNQSGVGRGFYTAEDVEEVHREMARLLNDASPDAIYFCPHRPDENCSCRKPLPGMILRAAESLDIDLSRSFMVGDKESDVLAGKRAGCRTILVRQTLTSVPPSQSDQAREGERADYVAEDLLSAAKWIIDRLNPPQAIRL